MRPTGKIGDALWALEEAHLALWSLMPHDASEEPPAPASLGGSLHSRLQVAEARVGARVDALPMVGDYIDSIRKAAPAILQVGSPPGVLAIRGWRRGTLVLAGTSGQLVHLEPTVVIAALAGARGTGHLNGVLDLLGSGAVNRQRAATAIAREIADPDNPPRIYRVVPPDAALRSQALREGVVGTTAAFVACHAAQYLLFLQSWLVLGRGLLAGRLSAATLAAWAALLAGTAGLRILTSWLQSRAGLKAAHLLRRKVLDGMIELDPDEIRHEGTGQLLGRVIDSETVQDLAVTGGLVALMSTVELAGAAAVLAVGPGGPQRAGLLALWVAAMAGLAIHYLRRVRSWTAQRHELTRRLVERMTGHRTRLAQQSPGHWHDGEPELRSDYLRRSVAMDRAALALRAGVHRGWMVVGIASIALAGGGRDQVALAVGGVLLAYQSLQLLTLGITQLALASVAWKGVGPLLVRKPAPMDDGASPDGTVVEARSVDYGRPGRRPVLRGCDLSIGGGERILLEGPSGAGKSTLAALLAGLREPSAGEIRGQGAVVLSPQFHENHLVLAPLVFNLLLGRGWPPAEGELEEAGDLCRALGLGPLLERMPSGLAQTVGETGWRLSHGERSLVFVARTIFQSAGLLILDESLGSLDPLTLSTALPAVIDRAPALMVIRQ